MSEREFISQNKGHITPVGDKEISYMEKQLGFALAKSYKDYLKEYGTITCGAAEFYGLGVPDSYYLNVMHRYWDMVKLKNYPKDMVPFLNLDDECYALVNSSGNVVIWHMPSGNITKAQNPRITTFIANTLDEAVNDTKSHTASSESLSDMKHKLTTVKAADVKTYLEKQSEIAEKVLRILAKGNPSSAEENLTTLNELSHSIVEFTKLKRSVFDFGVGMNGYKILGDLIEQADKLYEKIESALKAQVNKKTDSTSVKKLYHLGTEMLKKIQHDILICAKEISARRTQAARSMGYHDRHVADAHDHQTALQQHLFQQQQQQFDQFQQHAMNDHLAQQTHFQNHTDFVNQQNMNFGM